MKFIIVIVLFSMYLLNSNAFRKVFHRKIQLSSSIMKSSTISNSNNNSGKYILEYEYVSDILEKRTPYRDEHLALAEDLLSKNLLIAAGPFQPATGAVFLFNTNDKSIINSFIEKDPYVKAKLVTKFTVTEWNVVIGGFSKSSSSSPKFQ